MNQNNELLTKRKNLLQEWKFLESENRSLKTIISSQIQWEKNQQRITEISEELLEIHVQIIKSTHPTQKAKDTNQSNSTEHLQTNPTEQEKILATSSSFATVNKRINVQISNSLLNKCQGLLATTRLVRDFTYDSLSDLIRKSLTAYHQGKLSLTIPRPPNQPKKVVGVILPIELWEYYRSLPSRFRTRILEECLTNYLDRLMKQLAGQPLRTIRFPEETIFTKIPYDP